MADSKGYTALMYAASNGQDEVVKLLLKNSADKNIQSNKGNTALDFAMKNKHTNIISLLS
jgi:ankyrin repeat protein